jgi:LPXTG-site transpeptidase (sortase) family protein
MSWSVGSVARTAPGVTIIEPDLDLEKTADRESAVENMPVTYQVRLFHTADSQMDGFDVIVNDVLPEGVTYIPGSLRFVTGSGVAPTALDANGADPLTGRTLIRAVWNTLPLGAESAIEFSVRFGSLEPGDVVTNIANVEWTSLPGFVPAPPATYLSFYNQPYSHERRYDPLNPADVYRVQSGASVTVPLLPRTGFAPGRVTALPLQSAEQAYVDQGDMRLEIPRLGINIPVVGIPIVGDGWDLSWLWSQAGYLQGTAYPGRPGNSALTAHVYTPDGLPGPFVALASLRYGDAIILHANGQRYIYEVRSNRQVSPDSTSVLQHEEYAWLTLITCRGYNEASDSYRYRQVVRAVLVRTEIEP